MARAVRVKSPRQRDKDAARQQREARARRRQLMMFAGAAAVIAVVALIALGALTRGGGSSTPATLNRDGRVLGDPYAPVTVVAWEDFQCPFCKQAKDTVVAQLITDYVQTGKVKYEWRHFAFLGDESVQAAAASECASEQAKFWEYHDELFKRQSGENRGAYSNKNLKQIAASLNLDQAEFDTCLDSERYVSAVKQEKSQGDKLGVTGTPTFFINGAVVRSGSPYSVFKDMIDKVLQSQ